MKIFSLLLLAFFAFIFNSNSIAQKTKSEKNIGWVKGNPKAKIKLEVFNDYQCPTCASFNEKVKSLENEFPNELQITFRYFPLTQIHRNSMLATQAVEAAGMQGKFWEMSDLILENQRNWSQEKSAEVIFIEYAKKLELDVDKFKSDLESQTVKNKIDADIERGKSLSIVATPMVYLNGRKLAFEEMSDLEKIIKEILSK